MMRSPATRGTPPRTWSSTGGPTRSPALLALFEGHGQDGGPRASKEPPVNPEWPAGKRANHRIINRIRDGIERDVVLAIADNMESPSSPRTAHPSP